MRDWFKVTSKFIMIQKLVRIQFHRHISYK
uniref:Uncharacterized protein n=1 Tax=Siphoviridae sp. ctZHD14 TaxID=2827891 RepID=A0A8S5SW41_9CAUD|nr:MAG TPA: hypothetical protein [Siphoviridae sp. ctZHD14]